MNSRSWRDGKEQTVDVKLGHLPDSERTARASAAAQVEDRHRSCRSRPVARPRGTRGGADSEGVVVTERRPRRPAAEKGLKSGDVILEAGGQAVYNAADVRRCHRRRRKDGKSAFCSGSRASEGYRFVALPVDGKARAAG